MNNAFFQQKIFNPLLKASVKITSIRIFQISARVFMLYLSKSDVRNIKINNLIFLIKMLNQRKSWSIDEDKVLIEIYTQNRDKIQSHLINWNHIAEILNKHQFAHKRIGKQCRERYLSYLIILRWFNQLNPQINKTSFWTEEQKSKLLDLHNTYGNKWSLISKHFVKKTDNSIKNFMNSTLRKGLRLLNLYISKNKRFNEFPYKNIKEYKMELLTKVLFFSWNLKDTLKYEQNFLLSSNLQSAKQKILQQVYELSKGIKQRLLFLQDFYAKENISFCSTKRYSPIECFQTLIKEIHQLNAICRKRKLKNQSKNASGTNSSHRKNKIKNTHQRSFDGNEMDVEEDGFFYFQNEENKFKDNSDNFTSCLPENREQSQISDFLRNTHKQNKIGNQSLPKQEDKIIQKSQIKQAENINHQFELYFNDKQVKFTEDKIVQKRGIKVDAIQTQNDAPSIRPFSHRNIENSPTKMTAPAKDRLEYFPSALQNISFNNEPTDSFPLQPKNIFPSYLYSEEDYFLFDEMFQGNQNFPLYAEGFHGSTLTNQLDLGDEIYQMIEDEDVI